MSEAQRSQGPSVSITSKGKPGALVMQEGGIEEQDVTSPALQPLKPNRRSRPKRVASFRRNDEVSTLTTSRYQDVVRYDANVSISPGSIGMPVADVKLLAQATDNCGGWYGLLHARPAHNDIPATDDARVVTSPCPHLLPAERMCRAADTTARTHAVATDPSLGQPPHGTIPSQGGILKTLIDVVVIICCLFTSGLLVWIAPPRVWPIIWRFVLFVMSITVRCLWVTAVTSCHLALATFRILFPAALKATDIFIRWSFAMWISIYGTYVQA